MKQKHEWKYITGWWQRTICKRKTESSSCIYDYAKYDENSPELKKKVEEYNIANEDRNNQRIQAALE